MRTPITLDEFLFKLNQDEDMRIAIFDSNSQTGSYIYSGWKVAVKNFAFYDLVKDFFVEDFSLMPKGLEIWIIKELED